jgi:hypothetical protein
LRRANAHACPVHPISGVRAQIALQITVGLVTFTVTICAPAPGGRGVQFDLVLWRERQRLVNAARETPGSNDCSSYAGAAHLAADSSKQSFVGVLSREIFENPMVLKFLQENFSTWGLRRATVLRSCRAETWTGFGYRSPYLVTHLDREVPA